MDCNNVLNRSCTDYHLGNDLITDENRLECGTSLAEDEYSNNNNTHNESNENSSCNRDKQDSRSDSTNDDNKNSNNLLHATEAIHHDYTFGDAFNNNHPKSIDELREMIAADILQDSKQHSSNGSECYFTTFTSPFEQKISNRNSAGNNNIHQNRKNTVTDPGSSVTNDATKYQRKYYALPIIYCDQTASNRVVCSIETYISKVCLPLYGNTHTNTSITGSQSTAFVAEARQIVAEATNAKITGKAAQDIVLFVGNGATAAVELLIDCLGLKMNSSFRTYSDNNLNDEDRSCRRTVIFIGPYEHHSNLIPWRETGCDIVMIPEVYDTNDNDDDIDATGGRVDIEFLEQQLQKSKYKGWIKIGTFTAASNVTGKVCTEIHHIAKLMHAYNGLCFVDYATAAPYLSININPVDPMESLDGVFISPHKMLGGIGTPGILIVKKYLISQTNPPNRSGGGTVFYVSNQHHRFLSNRLERYEGGTPNVVGIIRIGLVFLLKRQIEEQYKKLYQQQQQQEQQQQIDPLSSSDVVLIPPTIQEYDFMSYKRIVSYLVQNAPNLVLLGVDKHTNNRDSSTNASTNVPIFSFLIRFGKRFLHYNYVCAILNDVFGIQSRGGCQCTGPYSQRLLGLSEWDESVHAEVPNDRNKDIENALIRYKERAELLRPGYTRLSLPCKGTTSEVVEYVQNALVWVSKHGWALMCQYRCNHRTGEWRHYNRQGKPLGCEERRWLSHYKAFGDNIITSNDTSAKRQDSITNMSLTLQQTMKNADIILEHAKKDQRTIIEASKMVDADLILGQDFDSKLEELRWYAYPKDCANMLKQERGLLSRNLDSKSNHTDTLLGAIMPNMKLATANTMETMNHLLESDARLGGIINDIGITQNERKRKFPTASEDDTSLAVATSTSCSSEIHTSKVESKSELSCQKSKSTYKDHSTELERGKKEVRDSTMWGTASSVPEEQPKLREFVLSEEKPSDTSINAQPAAKAKNNKFRHHKPPAKVMRLVTQALVQWDMIQEGDKLLLGLSGGKDSLTLLHCLLEFQRILPIKFDVEVCTIDPMTPSFDPSPLIPYVESFGLKYHYIRDNIVDRANQSGKGGKVVASLCAFCARMKRGNLYSCARRNNCNKLVLAQHLDDCAESFMMSVMHNGSLRTMKANYSIDAGDLSVIRPLIYCRESLMTGFAKTVGLPVINENCPACFEEPKERARIKKMLSREETMHPNFYDSIKRSLIPLMHDDMSPILRCYTEEIISRSRTKPKSIKKTNQSDLSSSGSQIVEHSPTNGTYNHVTADSSGSIADTRFTNIADEDLIRELARRRAIKFRQEQQKEQLQLVQSNEEYGNLNSVHDPTGQVCTLNGGNGSIPCRELME